MDIKLALSPFKKKGKTKSGKPRVFWAWKFERKVGSAAIETKILEVSRIKALEALNGATKQALDANKGTVHVQYVDMTGGGQKNVYVGGHQGQMTEKIIVPKDTYILGPRRLELLRTKRATADRGRTLRATGSWAGALKLVRAGEIAADLTKQVFAKTSPAKLRQGYLVLTPAMFEAVVVAGVYGKWKNSRILGSLPGSYVKIKSLPLQRSWGSIYRGWSPDVIARKEVKAEEAEVKAKKANVKARKPGAPAQVIAKPVPPKPKPARKKPVRKAVRKPKAQAPASMESMKLALEAKLREMGL